MPEFRSGCLRPVSVLGCRASYQAGRQAGISALFISPDGSLDELPFSTLKVLCIWLHALPPFRCPRLNVLCRPDSSRSARSPCCDARSRRPSAPPAAMPALGALGCLRLPLRRCPPPRSTAGSPLCDARRTDSRRVRPSSVVCSRPLPAQVAGVSLPSHRHRPRRDARHCRWCS